MTLVEKLCIQLTEEECKKFLQLLQENPTVSPLALFSQVQDADTDSGEQ
jgi:hypothetical protein